MGNECGMASIKKGENSSNLIVIRTVTSKHATFINHTQQNAGKFFVWHGSGGGRRMYARV